MNKTGKGGFVKGKSGNAGGRLRALPLIERDEQGRLTLEVIYAIRDDPKVDPRIRLSAALGVLPFLIGSPRQSLQISDNHKPVSTNIGRVPQLPSGD